MALARARPRRIAVIGLRAGVGTTTVAALLGTVLANERPDRVGIVDATPYAGGLAARLLSPPTSDGAQRAPARLAVRAVDSDITPAAVSAVAAGEDLVVVDMGADVVTAGRRGLLDDVDQLVVVDSSSADPGDRADSLDRLSSQGQYDLLTGAVIVLVDTDESCAGQATPPNLPARAAVAVVRFGFDPHLASNDVIEFGRLAGTTAAAARELTARASTPLPGAAPVGQQAMLLPAGLVVPALVIDTGSGSGPRTGTGASAQQDDRAPAAPIAAGRRPARTVVVCALVAVALGLWFATTAAGEDAVGEAAAVCGSAGAGQLPLHRGHSDTAAACVSTPRGAIAALQNSASLLIVDPPATISPGQDIVLHVSVRNLRRDDFQPATEGGYYAHPAELDAQGLIRGHVHGACRVLTDSGQAPEPDLVDAFAAIEDGHGGAAAETVEMQLSGRGMDGRVLFPAGSMVQCTVWAGDGGHGVPGTASARQMPAVDAVRISVGAS